MKILHAEWRGDHRFESAVSGGPKILLDGSAKAAVSPVDALLAALASCAGIDVVDILAKRKTPVESLSVEVIGERVDTTPRRLKHVTLRFTIAGAGIERVHAERAIELGITKYCSVRESLREDIQVAWTLDLQTPAGA